MAGDPGEYLTPAPAARQSDVVRRVLVTILTLALLALGTGALEYAHNHEHADHHADPHDESTCFLHAQLQSPLVSAANVPLLILAGLFVAFLTLLPSQPVSHRPLLSLDCRGPPAC